MGRKRRSDSNPDVVVFYAGRSLAAQLAQWNDDHPMWEVHTSAAKTTPGVRKVLRNASLALLDATENPDQAAKTFGVAVGRLGGYSVAVYTEMMRRWLELFVRAHGAVLLFGPLEHAQWEDFFEQMRCCRSKLPWWKLTGRFACKRPVRHDGEIQEEITSRFLSASIGRSKTGTQ